MRSALQKGAGERFRAQVLCPPHSQDDHGAIAAAWLQRAAQTLALAFVYCALEIVSHKFRFAGTQVAPLCPACGFALAVLYRCGNWASGGIFLGAFLASLTGLYVNTGGDPISLNGLLRFVSLHPLDLVTSTAKATAYTLEAIIGSALIRTFHSHSEIFDDVRGFVVFCVSAAVASAVGSGIVVAIRYVGVSPPEVQFDSAWLASWLRHFVGTFFLFPFVATWWRLISLRIRPDRALGGALALLLLLVLTLMATKTLQASFFVFPLLLFIVLTFDSAIAAAAIVIVSTIAVVATVNGVGLFARPDTNESVFLTQRLVFVVAFTVLLLSATIAERRHALANSEGALIVFRCSSNRCPMA